MTAFIVDVYNKYDQFDREHSRHIFEVNGNWYAIKEVQLKWGKPHLPLRLGDRREDEPYQIYETLEEALEFVHSIRQWN